MKPIQSGSIYLYLILILFVCPILLGHIIYEQKSRPNRNGDGEKVVEVFRTKCKPPPHGTSHREINKFLINCERSGLSRRRPIRPSYNGNSIILGHRQTTTPRSSPQLGNITTTTIRPLETTTKPSFGWPWTTTPRATQTANTTTQRTTQPITTLTTTTQRTTLPITTTSTTTTTRRTSVTPSSPFDVRTPENTNTIYETFSPPLVGLDSGHNNGDINYINFHYLTDNDNENNVGGGENVGGNEIEDHQNRDKEENGVDDGFEDEQNSGDGEHVGHDKDEDDRNMWTEGEYDGDDEVGEDYSTENNGNITENEEDTGYGDYNDEEVHSED